VGYSLQENAGVWAKDIRYRPGGIDFTAAGEDFRVPIHSDLVGAFNVSNILAAIAATVVGLDIPDETAARGIVAMGCVPGRMERIDLGQDFTAIVDFAHTPNALQRALETVRQMTPAGGRILAVFGSAGLRDRQKRRLMAEVSAKMADLTFLTAEDPRTESLDGILAEMASAALQAGGVEEKTFWRAPDRGEAIRLAVQMAQPGDLVIACGKGHEQSMCFGVTEYLWDDRIAMQSALAERLGVSGPKMPFLPTQKKES
jgi:UDP-N-acetylmuramoyl-L-alanyl-D-glutamate--2,6-diaminopimelate ligase